jgi:hypothetical protein
MKSSSSCCAVRICLGCALFFLIVAVSASAQKIKVEYDQNLDFSKFKTFAWGERDASSRPLLVLAIAGAIEEELTNRGLRITDGTPDLYVQMYGGTNAEMAASYPVFLYSGMGGLPPFNTSFSAWTALPGTSNTVVVHKGQLIVDIIDGARKKLIWRGMAKENLSDNRSKALDQVNTAVEKLFRKYPVAHVK